MTASSYQLNCDISIFEWNVLYSLYSHTTHRGPLLHAFKTGNDVFKMRELQLVEVDHIDPDTPMVEEYIERFWIRLDQDESRHTHGACTACT